MSLRAFHIFFILLAILLSFGVGLWGLRDYAASSNVVNRHLGVGSFIAGILLMGYLIWFLSKIRKIGPS